MPFVRSILLGILALAVLIGFWFFAPLSYSTNPSLVLETEQMPVFSPHTHEIGDSPSDQQHQITLRTSSLTLEKDVRVLGITFEVVNAPAVVLHHAMLRAYDLPNRRAGNPAADIITFGQDQMHNNRVDFPEGYALHILRGTSLRLEATLHNPLPPVGPGDTYENVSIRVVLHVAPSYAPRLRPLAFRLLYLLDGTDGSFTFTVPPRQETYAYAGVGGARDTATFTVSHPTTVVYMGGHLHGWQGGKELVLKKSGDVIQRFVTVRADDDTYRYDTPHYATRIELSSGDTISIEAVYENQSDIPTRGVMGILGLYYTEE